jgi:hypothetical protein
MSNLPPGFVLDNTPAVAVNEGPSGARVGAQEAKTRETQTFELQAMRQMLQDLGRAQYLNRVLPTGRLEAAANIAKSYTPTGWQDEDVGNFQTFNALQRDMLRPWVAMMSPAGTVNGKQFDAAVELQMAQDALPSPRNVESANRAIINRAAQRALDRVARAEFDNRWRARFGSLYTPAPAGQTASEAWAEYTRSPQYQATVARPITPLVDQAIDRVKRGRTTARPTGQWGRARVVD